MNRMAFSDALASLFTLSTRRCFYLRLSSFSLSVALFSVGSALTAQAQYYSDPITLTIDLGLAANAPSRNVTLTFRPQGATDAANDLIRTVTVNAFATPITLSDVPGGQYFLKVVCQGSPSVSPSWLSVVVR